MYRCMIACLAELARPGALRPQPLRGGHPRRWEDPGGSQRRRGVERAGLGEEMGRSAQGSGLPGRRKAVYPAGTAGGPCVGGPVDVGGVTAAVVTVTFNRAEYLQRHVDSLLAVHARDRSNRRAGKAGSGEWLARQGVAQVAGACVRNADRELVAVTVLHTCHRCLACC